MGVRQEMVGDPLQALVQTLSRRGLVAQAARFREVVYDGVSVDSEFDQLLIQWLIELAGMTELPEQLQSEAMRIAGVLRDPLSAYGKRGMVWLGSDEVGYSGHWEDDDSHLEDAPDERPLKEALAWALARSDRVAIRPAGEHPSTWYYAGPTPVNDFPPLSATDL